MALRSYRRLFSGACTRVQKVDLSSLGELAPFASRENWFLLGNSDIQFNQSYLYNKYYMGHIGIGLSHGLGVWSTSKPT